MTHFNFNHQQRKQRSLPAAGQPLRYAMKITTVDERKHKNAHSNDPRKGEKRNAQ